MFRQFTETLYRDGFYQGFNYGEILFEQDSEFQHIAIYQTPAVGRVLVLDGVIQTTEADEFIYHEMLAHVPLMSVTAPRQVLVVGGGDGGTVREVLKHAVESVDLVEIDQLVIDASREFLPTLNDNGRAFDDRRVNLVVQDAFEYLKTRRGEYDAIIIDSTDPIGAAEALFSDEFYRLCHESLTPQGVLSAQDGVVFYQRDEVGRTVAALRRLGLHAGAYVAAVPTYFGGVMAFGIAGREAGVLTPDVSAIAARGKHLQGNTRQYSPAIHAASFVLPEWVRTAVEGSPHA